MNKVFKVALFYVCCLVSISVNAQQNHFIYIQSDDKVPFDVTVNGATYNSSSIGYVIIPKLSKGNYQFNVSFPNKKFPEQQFACSVDKVDAGFALKNYGEKGWGLYNLQSLEITMAAGAAAPITEQIKPVENNVAFGNMLSEVANDSTLNLKTEPAKTEKEKPIVEANKNAAEADKNIADNKGNEIINKNNVAAAATITTVAVASESEKPALQKITESSTNAGKDMVFVDKTNGLNDTIRIFLPVIADSLNDTSEVVKSKEQQAAVEKTSMDTSVIKKEESFVKKDGTANTEVNNPFFKKDDQKSVVNSEAAAVIPAVIGDNNKEIVANKEQPSVRSDCKSMLSDNDMDKLKKKMVGADNDEKMIGVAKKVIQDKCITTDQVKSLGALFLSDDSRFSFFSTVYPMVYDAAAYSSLENQLIDPAYKKRFQAFIK